jgi:aspartate/methionine/tyrosine aminotransferase
MNFAPPPWITKAAEDALQTVAANHYSHPRGRLRLREALKAHLSPQFGRELSVESEILITSGANEGLLAPVPAPVPPSHAPSSIRHVLRLDRVSRAR